MRDAVGEQRVQAGQPVTIPSVETPSAAGSRSRTAATSRRSLRRVLATSAQTGSWSPQAGQLGSRCTATRVISMVARSTFEERVDERRLRAGQNFSASSAWSEPITPATGPATPVSAHVNAPAGIVGNAQR